MESLNFSSEPKPLAVPFASRCEIRCSLASSVLSLRRLRLNSALGGTQKRYEILVTSWHRSRLGILGELFPLVAIKRNAKRIIHSTHHSRV